MESLTHDGQGVLQSQQPLSRVLRNKKWRKHDETLGQYYMPLRGLCAVMTRTQVTRELRRHNIPEEYVHCICQERLGKPSTKKYTKLFAILVRLDKTQEIVKFVSAGLSDEKLPFVTKPNLELANSECYLFENQDSTSELDLFSTWRVQDREHFERVQWEFIVHFFQLRPDASIQPPVRDRQWVQCLHSKTYLPWQKHMPIREPHQISRLSASGAQGSVSHFDIDDADHDFHNLLSNVRLRILSAGVAVFRVNTSTCRSGFREKSSP